MRMRATFFPDHPAPKPPRPGPLLGRRVLLVLAPVGSRGSEVRRLRARLRTLGVEVALASECHGEARDEKRRALLTNLLLVQARPEEFDALVVMGGRGAERLRQDVFLRELISRFAAAERAVGAVGQGRSVLQAARVGGLSANDAHDMAAQLALRLGDVHILPRRGSWSDRFWPWRPTAA
jgi:putative intracellular protease/amidase